MIFRNGKLCVTIISYGQKPDENGVSILDRVLRRLVEAEREKNGRKTQTTMIIVDSKSIQNADTAEKKGMTRKKSIWDKTAHWG